ncbi:MAG: hypothetical protein M5R42_03460 [Rhodocyclaceae bacterium]|nr:hypothetical protein [Rhodocyclaceae bacterium]
MAGVTTLANGYRAGLDVKGTAQAISAKTAAWASDVRGQNLLEKAA